MATAAEKGCFTLMWEMKNFSVLLSNIGSQLESPDFKTITSEGSEWRTIMLYNSDHGIMFVPFLKKDNSKSLQTFDRLKVSILSSRGEIPLPEKTYTILKNQMLGINNESLLHDDTLTISCKIQQANMETGEIRIRTALFRDNFTWNINNFQSCSCYTVTFEKEKFPIYLFLKSNNSDSHIHTFQVEALPNIAGYISFVDISPSINAQLGRIVQMSSCFLRATRIWEIEIFPWPFSRNFQLQLKAIYAVHKELSDVPFSLRCAGKGSATKVVTKSSDSLNGDLLHLYRTALHSDATIQTEGRSFPVHKGILSIRSEVFRAMFEKDQMSEGRSGVVDIDDVDSETVDRMLVFLYGDSLDDIQWEEAAALYYAADKYAVHTLKQKCADILKAKLSVANVCDVLVLADQHSDQDLMTCTVNFILDHKEVISSPDWEKLEESNFRLASKVTKEILLKKWVN